MNRINFIKAGAVAAGAFVVPFPVKANQDKLKLRIVGTGSCGTEMLLKGAPASGEFEVVALSHVNSPAIIITDEGDMACRAKFNLIIDKPTINIGNNDHRNAILQRPYFTTRIAHDTIASANWRSQIPV